jgi:hypothetical protein
MPSKSLPPEYHDLFEKYVERSDVRRDRLSRRDFVAGVDAAREEQDDLRARQKTFLELQQRSLRLQADNVQLRELLTQVQRLASDIFLDIGETLERR